MKDRKKKEIETDICTIIEADNSTPKKISIVSVLIFAIILFAIIGNAQEKGIYSGGMLIVQPGIIITQNDFQQIRDLGFGLGGIMRFYITENLTAGIYGGTQKTTYNSTASSNSFISLGYGGPFFGFSKRVNRLRYTASVFAGRGSVKNLHIEAQENNLLSDAYLYKSKTWVFSPLISLDYALTERLLISFQTICLIADYNQNTFYSPTFQIGILFNR